MSFQPIEADDKDILVFHDILGQESASSSQTPNTSAAPQDDTNLLNSGPRPVLRTHSPSEDSPLKADGQIGPRKPSIECCGFGIGAVVLVSSAMVLAFSLTIGLILSIRFGPPQIPPSGAVVSPSQECSQIGLDLMKDKRASSADAAIAMALCAGVVRAESSGLGGDGFAIFHDHRRSTERVFIGRSCSPTNLGPLLNAMKPDASLNKSGSDFSAYRLTGWAVAAPTELSLFYNLHKSKGKLTWKEIFTPVIELARSGFKLLPETVAILKGLDLQVLDSNMESVAKYYLVKDASANKSSIRPVGSLIKRPDLADLLQKIADDPEKFRFFYENETARNTLLAINKRSPEGQGLFPGATANFSTSCVVNITEQAPLNSSFKDFTIMYPGLPSAGIAVAEILGILSQSNSSKQQVTDDVAELHQLIFEASKFAFSDLYDATAESAKQLLNASYWQSIYSQINLASPPSAWSAYSSRGQASTVGLPTAETTGNYVAALDENEKFVALTLSLGSPFGSMIATADGIVLNNHMEAFYYNLPDHPNAVKPDKQPWSVQAPIVAHVPNSCKIRAAVGVVPYIPVQFSSSKNNQINTSSNVKLNSAWHVIPNAAEVIARLLVGKKSSTNSLQRWRYSPLPLTGGEPSVILVEGNFTDMNGYAAASSQALDAFSKKGYQVAEMTSPMALAGVVSKESDHIYDRLDPRGPSISALNFGAEKP